MEVSSGRYITKSARKKENKNTQGRKRSMLYGFQREWNAIKLNARRRELLFIYNPLCTLELVISRKNKQSDTDQRQHTGLDCMIADRLNLFLSQATVDRAQIISPHSIESYFVVVTRTTTTTTAVSITLMHANSSGKVNQTSYTTLPNE
ncbi:hypothetical protein DAPPUDRAFT_236631 [Daphnia pulex]|uniref:Uncharacterized protein n=1 Tax=Daphnia pulex TaxID=6669 RepID=E9G2Q2_DAPPU|nr:hypothetical protein DAPPUDRAFT_236631 [Daphnia pulex]|eukprot:EFX86472.1 hypothetical protein DAPPUDRAFT_236631 [Daphnia pulex]